MSSKKNNNKSKNSKNDIDNDISITLNETLKTYLDNKTTYEKNNTKENVSNNLKTRRIAIYGIIINAILAIFTYLLFKEATKQSKTTKDATVATEKSVNLSKISFDYFRKSDSVNSEMKRKEVRAYIVMAPDKPIFEDSIIKCKVVFINKGNTPAHNIEVYGGFYSDFLPYRFSPSKIKTGQKFTVEVSQEIINELILGKSNYNKITLICSGNWFESEMIGWPGRSQYELLHKFIKNNVRPLFLCGKITYRDIFNCQHFYQFCFIYIPSKNSFGVYEKYNDAD
jgi:hypothetical protein